MVFAVANTVFERRERERERGRFELEREDDGLEVEVGGCGGLGSSQQEGRGGVDAGGDVTARE